MPPRHHRVPFEATEVTAELVRSLLGLPASIAIEAHSGDLIVCVRKADGARLRVNGRPLSPGRHALLGDEVLKHRGRRVRLVDERREADAASGTRTFARAALASPIGAVEAHGPLLAVLEGRAAGRRWPLRHGRQIIGRKAGCEVVIDDSAVSRRHAEVRVGADAVTIRDLGSRHGVLMGRRKTRRERRLRHGDEIVLGTTRLRLLLPRPQSRNNEEKPRAGWFARGQRTPLACNAKPGESAGARGASEKRRPAEPAEHRTGPPIQSRTTQRRRGDGWAVAIAVGLLMLGGTVSAVALGL